MWFWIIGAVVVVALAVWAFSPSRRTGLDGRVRRQEAIDRRRIDKYRQTRSFRWPNGG